MSKRSKQQSRQGQTMWEIFVTPLVLLAGFALYGLVQVVDQIPWAPLGFMAGTGAAIGVATIPHYKRGILVIVSTLFASIGAAGLLVFFYGTVPSEDQLDGSQTWLVIGLVGGFILGLIIDLIVDRILANIFGDYEVAVEVAHEPEEQSAQPHVVAVPDPAPAATGTDGFDPSGWAGPAPRVPQTRPQGPTPPPPPPPRQV